ncbi:hypothetical protein [Haloarcula sebkhae]|uniref:Uncharacterized protein n=2 Tax=Haloarcula sebkhae TaxID=932660 RepID=A0ACC6VLJ7_9EURY|nr:hypothetical protein [Haloarcula sebkhae]GGK84034.1 hypothetical protein GCM10009067_40300 [Haloarcula sebkhae]
MTPPTDQLADAREAVAAVDLNELSRADARIILNIEETLEGLEQAYSDSSEGVDGS